jgi:hypothetical protein
LRSGIFEGSVGQLICCISFNVDSPISLMTRKFSLIVEVVVVRNSLVIKELKRRLFYCKYNVATVRSI